MSELAKVQKLLEADPTNEDHLSLQKDLVEVIHLTRVSARENKAKASAAAVPNSKPTTGGDAKPATKADADSQVASKQAAARKAALKGQSIGIDLGTT